MTKKIVSLLTVLTTLNIIMLPAFANSMGDAIVAGFQANTEKKITKANEAKDYSGELTFLNNHLKLDKAFTKRYNELQPNEAKNCHVTVPTDNCTDKYKLTEGITKKSNRENIEYWESQMQSARTLSALGQVYYCAKKATTECHYVGGAGGVAKTVNGSARFISKVSEFFGGDGLAGVDDKWDVRTKINDLKTDVSDQAVCKTSIDSAANTTKEYLAKLEKCEHIDQVRLSEYTEEDIQNLLDDYESKKANANSKANRLLTSLSMAATGIGGKELAQGLAEQKADRVAEQSMSAYIATMRCSYGNGKQVKAGTEEIELPGGNDGNIMKYRAEYVTLAADLKERKTALGLKPGIESEEILDKSQMGLYDDENIGISDGAYASLYRAQMLGSEKDQQQIDDAKQTSKNRVIGGAVAAGVGVVGGIIGDELINQSLSSSTKTAQTCTESGGTWQGGRCHCPDGFIQHTKTGPCFEEKPTEVQTTTNQQTSAESSNSTPPQGQNNNSSNSDNNSDGNSNGNNNIEPDINTYINESNIPNPLKLDKLYTYHNTNKDKILNLFTQQCLNQNTGASAMVESYPNDSGDTDIVCTCITGYENKDNKCVLEQPTLANSDIPSQTQSNNSTPPPEPTCGVVGKKECDSNYYVCASDSDCTSDKLPANATAGHCWKSGSRSVCTATACKDGFEPKSGYCQKRAIADRNTNAQKTNTSTAQRASTTEAKQNNAEQKKTLTQLIGSNNLGAKGTNWRAKMKTSKRTFCEVKGDALEAKMERCKGLNEDQWDATFSYGTIKGTSSCETSYKDHVYCKCSVQSYTNSKKTYTFAQSSLVKTQYYFTAGSAGYECSMECPKVCAKNVMSDEQKRKQIFEKSGVHQ